MQVHVEFRSKKKPVDVTITPKAILKWEQDEKSSFDDALKTGLVQPLFQVTWLSMCQRHREERGFDDWVDDLDDLVVRHDPEQWLTDLLIGASADVIDTIVARLQVIADERRAGVASKKGDREVPTGGATTPSTDGAPSPSSGQD